MRADKGMRGKEETSIVSGANKIMIPFAIDSFLFCLSLCLYHMDKLGIEGNTTAADKAAHLGQQIWGQPKSDHHIVSCFSFGPSHNYLLGEEYSSFLYLLTVNIFKNIIASKFCHK